MCDLSGGIRTVAAFAGLAFLALAQPACAQGITVAPVNVQMGPGQKATVLTVVNQGDRETSFQIRAFGWQQNQAGDDQLAPTDELLASPPLATVAPGATQIVRLVLRRPPQTREATYRIFFDQLTPPGEAGRVHVALRLSIPVFAEPTDRLDAGCAMADREPGWAVLARRREQWLPPRDHPGHGAQDRRRRQLQDHRQIAAAYPGRRDSGAG